MCGEQSRRTSRLPWSVGSPPRVRGTGLCGVLVRNGVGITPACAGNSVSYTPHPPGFWDHPRVCGEQFICICILHTYTGSPPRVRGTAVYAVVNAVKSGITPACAGNSEDTLNKWCKEKDHPRVCGEQSIAYRQASMWWGSPPRVRGTDRLTHTISLNQGITPACAGNSSEVGIDGIWE